MIPINLTGKLALITGATGQLGRVMVRTLAQAGAGVIICYHKDEITAQTLLRDLAPLNVPLLAAQADITDQASIIALRDRVAREIGHPDIIVNNAVIQYTWLPLMQQSPTDYESQFRSCVLHNVLMAQAFVPAMVQKKWGRIIGINTECAMQNFENQSAYVSGKRGMDGVLRVLAKEVGPHQITVNQVAPGWMISDKDRQAGTEKNAAYDKTVPLKHRGTDQDIANAVAFLTSDLASFITGAYLPVCGGNVMPAI